MIRIGRPYAIDQGDVGPHISRNVRRTVEDVVRPNVGPVDAAVGRSPDAARAVAERDVENRRRLWIAR